MTNRTPPILFLLLFLFTCSYASDSLRCRLTVSGYAEGYFAAGIRSNADSRPGFLYNHTLQNRPALNLAYLKGAMQCGRVNVNLGLMNGSYAQTNLSAEPELLRSLLEANLGLQLSHSLRADIGILPSHIGFESAKGADCPNLTRSIVAENTPYFETGIRLSYSHSERFSAGVLLMNNWQRITLPAGSKSPAAGWQLTAKAGNRIQIGSNSWFGYMKADSTGKFRLYHNLYVIITAGDKTSLILNLDTGLEHKGKHDSGFNSVLSPVFIVSHRFSEKWKGAFRMEGYYDRGGLMLYHEGQRSLVSGASLNADYSPLSWLMLRAEMRMLYNPDPIFRTTRGESRLLPMPSVAVCASF